jgi:PAS domain S-box-containing protein
MDKVDDRALLLALLDAAVDGIVVSDSEGTILRTNNAAARLFGHSIETLNGQNVRMLMPADVASRHDGAMQHHLKTGERRIIGIGRDAEGLHADGTVFPLYLSVGRADMASQVAFVAILRDQTQRKAAEEAEARSQRMGTIGQMTGGITHDFNNLLTVVIGNLELLEMSETAGARRVLIADALEAAGLGADLASRLMVFARHSTLKCSVIAVNEAVTDALAMLKRAIRTQISVEASLADDLWPAHANETQLQTAVLNLALNAQDAMPAGGKIFVETRNVVLDDIITAQDTDVKPGRYVSLSVRDTGEGMSEETRRRAMEPFFTTKPVGKGTGLGLSMVYGFVKQCGGHLTICSEIGQGTKVTLYFPTAHAAED